MTLDKHFIINLAHINYAELLRALFLDGEDKSPRLKRRCPSMDSCDSRKPTPNGQPRALPFECNSAIYEKKATRKNAIGLGCGEQQSTLAR